MPCGVTPGPYVPLKPLTLLSMAVVVAPGTSFKIQKPLGLSPSTWLMKSARAGWAHGEKQPKSHHEQATMHGRLLPLKFYLTQSRRGCTNGLSMGPPFAAVNENGNAGRAADVGDRPRTVRHRTSSRVCRRRALIARHRTGTGFAVGIGPGGAGIVGPDLANEVGRRDVWNKRIVERAGGPASSRVGRTDSGELNTVANSKRGPHILPFFRQWRVT